MWCLISLVIGFWGICNCDSSNDALKSVLVLTENVWIKDSHSIFLRQITESGYQLTIRVADDSSLTLMKYGEYLYKHIILLAPSVTEFGGTVSVKELVKFVDEGGNVIVAGSKDIGEAIREIGVECGVEFDEMGTAVIDHHNYDITDDGTHTKVVVAAENLIKNPIIIGNASKSGLLYRGVGISSDPANPLLISVLRASRTAYSYSPSRSVTDYPNSVGTNTHLIVALQARNNARVLFLGSLDFLSNEFFRSPVKNALSGVQSSVSGNKQLMDNLVPWVFGERGQLRVAGVEHHLAKQHLIPSQYTIMDEVYYSIIIETKSDSGDWVPFKADDVQLEFVRIDPFIRRTLEFKDGKYSTVLRLPDVYGVFKFVVDYHRVGYTHLISVQQVPVRPFTHTQYERFIVAAYPYYFSAISMLVGVVLFTFIFLYYRDEKEKSD
ncbi:Dolichyl-diphosphooligosaccharide--protein glycosyltransferase 48 kDa subunit [Fasciola gigantica]|uniref:Dolichyl-diphosphooligosaccharide--protein glycosyltransferase 48 kDa subunit n=1 Tax=Fasciola gigantica TaxID=46835 RepID=A0A504Z1D2_FASGI|nr:Dolichyl-diphosphooligosaccharide--protein glycosyltransferase 48 kDa subunit [Fasciola gigantica]